MKTINPELVSNSLKYPVKYNLKVVQAKLISSTAIILNYEITNNRPYVLLDLYSEDITNNGMGIYQYDTRFMKINNFNNQALLTTKLNNIAVNLNNIDSSAHNENTSKITILFNLFNTMFSSSGTSSTKHAITYPLYAIIAEYVD